VVVIGGVAVVVAGGLVVTVGKVDVVVGGVVVEGVPQAASNRLRTKITPINTSALLLIVFSS